MILPNGELAQAFLLACINNGIHMGPGGMVALTTAIQARRDGRGHRSDDSCDGERGELTTRAYAAPTWLCFGVGCNSFSAFPASHQA